jgi:CubicO group peptidase (beta-lactamase class C family)
VNPAQVSNADTVRPTGGGDPAPTLPVVDAGEVAGILDEFRRDTSVPGVAASLFTHAGVVAQAAQGVSCVERPDVAMTPRTVGAVHSLSKVMTATALAVLATRGQVDLDEPIARHLPDVRGRERFGTTTVRHLLGHASGLVRGPVPMLSAVTRPDPLEQYVLGACLGAPRFAQPGEVFGYSEIGIMIAGYLLQRLAGKPFAHAMDETLFAPAGMIRTTMDPLVAMTFSLSQQHVRAASGELTIRRRFDAHPATLPSSGAFSCTEDLARLGVVHLRGPGSGGDPPLLSVQVGSDLHAPTVDVGLDIARAYGLAIATGPRYGDVMSVGHEGHYGGSWAKLQVIPDQRVGVAWLDNTGDDPAITPQRQHFFDRLMRLLGAGERNWRRAPEPDDVDLAGAAGRYGRPAGRPIEITPGAYGVRATDGVVTVDYRHLTGRVFVARDGADVLARIPWAPDRDSTRSALSVVGPSQAPTHVLVNGLPYRRVTPRPAGAGS